MGRECCGKQHRQQSLVPTRVIVGLRAAWAHSKRQRFGIPISRFLFPASVGSKNVASEKGKTAPRVRCTARAWVDPVPKTPSARTSSKTPSNAIWLCQNCTKPFDIDPIHSPLELQQMSSEPRTNGDRL